MRRGRPTAVVPTAASNAMAGGIVYPDMTGDVLEALVTGQAVDDSAQDRLRDLFEVHRVALYRLARRMTRSTDEAMDLVQDTFLRAAGSIRSVPQGRSSEEAWLVRVLVNRSRDIWRQRATREGLESRHLVETRPLSPSDPESSLIASTLVWQAMQRLSPRCRAIVILCELDGVSVKDAARVLSVTTVTIRWYLSHGRRKLGRIIAESEDGGAR